MTEEQVTPKQIAFVAYPGLTLLDLVGPLQTLSVLPLLGFPFETVTVGETLDAIDTDVGLKIVPNKTFDEVPDPLVIIVPGGTAPTLRALSNERLLNYLRSAAESAEAVASVCTGSLILAAAGLLDNAKASTHWSFSQQLERLGVEYIPERWVEQGKVIASAGVSAGIDMALQLAARLTNEQVARQIQLILEYDPQPPFGPIDWSQVDRHSLDPLVNQWVHEGLAERPDLIAKLTR
ncbi:MAG: DJ-1/PfpI family protein [Actinomycetota bacterium]|nr:DJ-1/PfpI family protein [Actinomycetota bacterium]